MNIAAFGNDLYTGKRSIDFIGRRRTWYLVSVILFVIAMLGLGVRQLNLGIEFTGGSDFRITKVNNFDSFEQRARSVISSTGQVEGAKVTKVGGSDVRVETERFDPDKAKTVSDALAKEFGVTPENVTTSVIGPSWGASVSKQALQALAWFLLLVSVVLAIYFRTWKMSLAALVALFHDIFITVGIYSLAGFEVTPASMIGFLTILGYSLYDTVVVFDKVRENTDEAISSGRKNFTEAANLAINQTLVRSINTTVVALLPVGAILVMGLAVIGPGTLTDLSLALFVGIAVGAYSSIFIATPLYAHLRDHEPEMQKLAHQVERRKEKEAARALKAGTADVSDGDESAEERSARRRALTETASLPAVDDDSDGDRTATGRAIHPSLQNGPRNQPRRLPRSKR
ncbi:protein translocase subunit SecF [Austwickia chelonae]|uniref:protein translocase subunit SecF n=1 Tax=Austwickia chelonae TaxID=100225 RepID=UPI000E24FD72|nr:protein translocase subunit SecF [Austwickia chelonae]